MKKIGLIVLTLCLSLSFVANAQHRGPREKLTPEQQATRMVERLNKELQLSDKQQTELKTWFTQSFTEQQTAMEKNKGNREAMHEQMKKQREATDAQLKKVLTAEQYKKYKANQEKREKEREQNRDRRPMRR